jgi:hypothetical protein
VYLAFINKQCIFIKTYLLQKLFLVFIIILFANYANAFSLKINPAITTQDSIQKTEHKYSKKSIKYYTNAIKEVLTYKGK